MPGTFFADRAADRIYLGTDPTGHEVRTSALQTAITINSAGSVLRGVGVRRYATSLPLMGTVRALGRRRRSRTSRSATTPLRASSCAARRGDCGA